MIDEPYRTSKSKIWKSTSFCIVIADIVAVALDDNVWPPCVVVYLYNGNEIARQFYGACARETAKLVFNEISGALIETSL